MLPSGTLYVEEVLETLLHDRSTDSRTESDSCRYRHACKGCGIPGHGKSAYSLPRLNGTGVGIEGFGDEEIMQVGTSLYYMSQGIILTIHPGP